MDKLNINDFMALDFTVKVFARIFTNTITKNNNNNSIYNNILRGTLISATT
jgi:hypothetical protein